MNFELKSVKYSALASQETNFFSAYLYADGVKIAECFNEGHGGNTCINSLDGKQAEFKTAEAYALAQPKTVWQGHTFDTDLELIVDELLADWLLKKEEKKDAAKLKKKFLNNICWGIPGGERYKTRGWSKYTISQIAAIAPDKLKEVVDEVKAELKEGEVILNTNLEKFI